MNEEKVFWQVWLEGTDGGYHYIHETYELAEKEAERIARNHPGQKVYILQAINYCVIPEPPADWVTLGHDEIPF